ncbi:MAG: stage III sporulation protein AD [Candidatus Syntrophonatronum acetioxidans]|uniref:Stage III sporulation protein AD n=1 Tax=Candidatus Syntrophonatronum acetioxidans TaxID=1795816 RepID=A0A424YFC0_9FIRM|nr:MAG: stage III sporulation protein AD [Candidatus Syntrophonatronum acetioxidans]
MGIIQIAALGLLTAAVVIFLKETRPEMAVILSLALGILIFIFLINYIADILRTLEELTLRADINIIYLNTLLRIMGIAYIAEFSAQVCRDAGEGATASKIEFAGKVFILALALPLIMVVLETIMGLIP